jgi:hypothetical protein
LKARCRVRTLHPKCLRDATQRKATIGEAVLDVFLDGVGADATNAGTRGAHGRLCSE